MGGFLMILQVTNRIVNIRFDVMGYVPLIV